MIVDLKLIQKVSAVFSILLPTNVIDTLSKRLFLIRFLYFVCIISCTHDPHDYSERMGKKMDIPIISS